jgi:hypothetical protein
MHISPTALAEHRKATTTAVHGNKKAVGTAVLGGSATADMYALGCIANQIYFRENLYSEDEHLEGPGEFSSPNYKKRAVKFSANTYY